MESQEIPIATLVSDPYYQKEFQKIYDSNEIYKGKWNWWAFFFTGLWAILKGCWVLFILFVLTNSLLRFTFHVNNYFYVNFGVMSLVWSLVMGYRGTWFYYVRIMKKKQPPF